MPPRKQASGRPANFEEIRSRARNDLFFFVNDVVCGAMPKEGPGKNEMSPRRQVVHLRDGDFSEDAEWVGGCD